MKQKELPARFERNFLSKLDGRVQIARELRGAYDELTADLGGVDGLSHVKLALVERFIWLEAVLRGIERKLAEGNEKESPGLLGQWVQATNSLLGLGKVLGLERRAKKLDLKSYVEGKRA